MPDAPCFVLIEANGEELETGDGSPHYPTIDAANEWAPRFARDASGRPCPAPTPKQLDKPCAFVQCSECETFLDEEGECVRYHFTSQQEADEAARNYDWRIDGDKRTCLACIEESEPVTT